MYLQLAVRNLGRARVRSALAVIGIIIGVTAITSIGIFGENLKKSVIEGFGDVANELILIPNAREGYKSIDEKVVETIRKAPFTADIIPVKTDAGEVLFRGSKRIVTVYGMDEDAVREMFKAEKGTISLKSGRCVVGWSLAQELEVKVGSKISVGGRIYRVSAILEREGARFDINPNGVIIVSSRDIPAEYSMVIVKLASIDDIEPFKKFVSSTVNLKDERVEIFEMRSILERIDEVFNQINMFLMAIAGISLLVAGVSILNIMLMSTIERTKEIGIMRAIGARKSVILRIFLLEAAILGVAGSVVGAVLSIAGGYAITKLIVGDVGAMLTATTAVFAAEGFLFGVFTAVISGLYPAWRAANLEPIEALRYE
ncbi:ABC-type transport system, involved in lipoprotein release, permease component [Geoglobus ahangari]|uniref:ABC-type transport system, involved in lipoprotein release, permease component n=1 Tax=Geoglobus ahangari TaxID=113653 RepID=A0A0F7DC04_9EURY|nr:ABC transporter permease [Geoglobus ahangari]AKG91996.1 ABC-type transport system, involved in lipoprotein release, permease component [Geoglobus ahangari]